MYLPTFWKLTAEATFYRVYHVSGYLVPVGSLGVWILYPSLYNYVFSCVLPPPTGKQFSKIHTDLSLQVYQKEHQIIESLQMIFTHYLIWKFCLELSIEKKEVTSHKDEESFTEEELNNYLKTKSNNNDEEIQIKFDQGQNNDVLSTSELVINQSKNQKECLQIVNQSERSLNIISSHESQENEIDDLELNIRKPYQMGLIKTNIISVGHENVDDSSEGNIDNDDEFEIYHEDEGRARALPKSLFNDKQKLDDDFCVNDMTGTQGYIARKLVQLGYQERIIGIMFKNLKINDLEQAVDFLERDASGWSHPFICTKFFMRHKNTAICDLCGQGRASHQKTSASTYIQDQSLENLYDQAEKMILGDRSEIESPQKLLQTITYSCGICYSEIKEDDLFQLKCKHTYCQDCLKEYISFQITNGNTTNLGCPEKGCLKDINLKLLTKHLMTPDIYQKYIKFNGRKEVNRNPGLKWCPTPDCEGYLQKPLQAEINDISCFICKKITCFGCLQPPHSGQTCDSVLDKEYQEWAGMKAEVGKCKSCQMRIEKSGGCPNMTCQICKHEWCWICNEDFPVHLQSCPNYYQYLEVLEFQGQIDFDNLDINFWFIRSDRSSFLYWLTSVIFLLVIVMPLCIVLNVILTPLYIFIMYTNILGIERSTFKVWWKIMLLTIFFLISYGLAPIILIVVTIPQIGIFAIKKTAELKDLCKNRMRFYSKLNPTPIMRRYMRKIYFIRPRRRVA